MALCCYVSIFQWTRFHYDLMMLVCQKDLAKVRFASLRLHENLSESAVHLHRIC